MSPAAGVKVACCGCFESVASSRPSLEYVTRPGHASGQRCMPGVMSAHQRSRKQHIHLARSVARRECGALK
jgi:hypothetical protein